MEHLTEIAVSQSSLKEASHLQQANTGSSQGLWNSSVPL